MKKLYLGFIFTAISILIIIIGVLSSGSIDIQQHDTYFVIGYSQIAFAISFFTSLPAFIYFILGKRTEPASSKIRYYYLGMALSGILLIISGLVVVVTFVALHGFMFNWY